MLHAFKRRPTRLERGRSTGCVELEPAMAGPRMWAASVVHRDHIATCSAMISRCQGRSAPTRRPEVTEKVCSLFDRSRVCALLVAKIPKSQAGSSLPPEVACVFDRELAAR